MKINIKPEEEALYKGLKKNYGSSYYITGVFLPEFYKRSKTIYAAYILFKLSNFIGALLWLYALVKSIILRPYDFHILTECVHMGALLSLLVVMPIIFSIYQEELKRILRAIGAGLYHYGDTLDEETKKVLDDFKNDNEKQRELLTKVMVILIVSVCTSHCALRPLGDLLTNDRLLKPDDPDGIVYTLPMDMWYYLSRSPFEIFIAYLHLVQLFFWGGHVINTVTTIALVYLHTLCAEYEMLCITMRRLISRAEFLYKKVRKGQTVENVKTDPIFHQCLRKALRDSIRHQQALLKYGKDTRQLFLYTLLCIVLLTTFLLCFGGIIFTSKGAKGPALMLYTCCMLIEVYNLFFYCYFGGKIIDLNSQIGDELYNTNWIEYGSIIKTEILIIQSSKFLRCGLSAGGFNDINMVTFSDVLKAAFSYFNVLNAVRN